MPFLAKFSKSTSNSTLWTQKKIYKQSPFPRQDYSICEILDDIYVFAGSMENIPQNDLHIIDSHDLSVEVAKTSGEIPCPRAGHTALNIGRYLLVFGGETTNSRWDDSLYSLNIGSKLWTRLPMQSNSLVGRRDHSAVAIESTMYLFGGQVDDYYFNDLVAFDTKSLSTQTPHWDYIASGYDSPPERACHSAVVYKNQIYIFGGNDVDKSFDDLWCYDPKFNIWSQILAKGGPSKRAGHTACVHNDFMFILGGQDESGQFLNEVYLFHFLERTWFVLPSVHLGSVLPKSIKTCVIQEKIHVLVGEYDSVANQSVVHILDTAKVGGYVELHSGGEYFSNAYEHCGHNGAHEKQIRNYLPPPSPVEYGRSSSNSDNDDYEINRLLTPSPTPLEHNQINGSSGQNPGGIPHISRAHSPSHLQAPSNFTFKGGKPNDVKTSLDSGPPGQYTTTSSTITKSNQLLNTSQRENNHIRSGDSNHLQNSTANSEDTAVKINIERSRDHLRQFATFIPLNTEKVHQPRSTEPGSTRSHALKHPSSNKNTPLNTHRKHPATRTTENIPSLIDSDSKLSSYGQSAPALEVSSKERIQEDTITMRDPTGQRLNSHGMASNISLNSYPENASSIFEERLPNDSDFEEEGKVSGIPPKHLTKQEECSSEILKVSKDTTKHAASKTALWSNVEKMVSERSDCSTKEASISPYLKPLPNDQKDPEKIQLLQALLFLKDQLSKAQAHMTQNCEHAARKISDGEKSRQVALQEAAYLRMKISAIKSSSTEELCKIEQDRVVELEKRLVKALTENQSLVSRIDLQTQVSAKDQENRLLMEENSRNTLNRVVEAEENCRMLREKTTTLEDALKKAQLTASNANTRASKAEATLYAKETEATVILERLASLEETSAQERQARELASNAVSAANERANEAERMWMDAQQEIQALEKESIELRKTIEQKSEELARAHFQAGEMETLWLTTKQQLESLDSISQVFNNSKNHSEEGIEEKLTRANYRVAELEGEVSLLLQVKEESCDVIDRIEKENYALTQKVEDLEKKHYDVQSELSESRLRLADAQDNIYEMKLQLMNSQDLLRAESLELEGARLKITTLANMMQEFSCAGGLDPHRLVALASDKLNIDLKSPEDNIKLRQQLESLQDRLNQTKCHNKELQEKYKNTLQELHTIVEKQQPLIDSEKAAKARVAGDEHEIARLKDQFLAMQVKANSLEELLRQSRPKPSLFNSDSESRIQINQNKVQQLERQLQESEKKSAKMEKDTQRAIKYVRDSESMLRKMKSELQRSQMQVMELTKQTRVM
ncbi:hypothetical protein K7432_012116 [Basidiobolus ranarum]|uniref:Uncharacterized protein n=1 Tax=Basidiobolus ranarum TaxID=34480 RepID=A0ABR2VSS5_9FUNG